MKQKVSKIEQKISKKEIKSTSFEIFTLHFLHHGQMRFKHDRIAVQFCIAAAFFPVTFQGFLKQIRDGLIERQSFIFGETGV